QFKDDFSWTRGKHQVKFGGELRRLRYNQIGAVVPRGRFTWNGQYSNSPMADMLLGFMSNSESQIGAPIANFRDNYYGLYVQDAWKLSPKMTMTLGLRWEAEPPFLDKHDAIVNSFAQLPVLRYRSVHADDPRPIEHVAPGVAITVHDDVL